MWILSLIVIFSSAISVLCQFPSYIEKCSRNDPQLEECVLRKANLALPYLMKGDQKYNLPQLSPFKLAKLQFNVGENLHYTLKNILSQASKDVEITKLKFDTKTHKLEFLVIAPLLTWYLDFDTTGTILGKSIHEVGQANVTFHKMQIGFKGDLQRKQFGNETYLQMKDGEVSTSSNQFEFEPYNRKSVNEPLKDEQDNIFKQNYKGILLALREQMKIVGKPLVLNIFNTILKLVPENQVFLP